VRLEKMRMNQTLAISAVLFAIVLAGCVQEDPDAAAMQSAQAKGLNFLETLDIQQDTMTPGELYRSTAEDKYEGISELELYRQMDFYINVAYLEEGLEDSLRLQGKIEKAHALFDSLVPKWEEGSIDYTYFDPGGKQGDYAFDLYCITALQQKNERMEKKVLSELLEAGWHTPEAQGFRVIIDESWCLSLLAAYHEDEMILNKEMNDKKEALRRFRERAMEGLDEEQAFIFNFQKTMASTHVLMLLHHMKINGYGMDETYARELQQQIAEETRENMEKKDYLVNALYWLSVTDYEDEAFLNQLAARLVETQEENGAWKAAFDSEHFQGLMTARALLALEEFKGK